jgi:hypothetical protein
MDAMPREPTDVPYAILPTGADDQKRMVEKSWIWMEDTTIATTLD